MLSKDELKVSDEGVVQGSCCSPVIANIVAHYVIDLWMKKMVIPRMRGKVEIFRYADDIVICCRYEEDAKRIKSVLGKRLNKYHLTLNEEKTKMISFSRLKQKKGIKQETFEFLGFRFYLGKSRKGAVIPKFKTSGKRFRSKLNRVKEWAKDIRSRKPLREIWKTFCAKLRGHVQYYGVSFNIKMVARFLHEAKRIVFKWLNRRSQRKSFDWEKFELFTAKYPLPQAKVVHRLF